MNRWRCQNFLNASLGELFSYKRFSWRFTSLYGVQINTPLQQTKTNFSRSKELFPDDELLTLRNLFHPPRLPRTTTQECYHPWKNSSWDWFLHQRTAPWELPQQPPLPYVACWVVVVQCLMYSLWPRQESAIRTEVRPHLPTVETIRFGWLHDRTI